MDTTKQQLPCAAPECGEEGLFRCAYCVDMNMFVYPFCQEHFECHIRGSDPDAPVQCPAEGCTEPACCSAYLSRVDAKIRENLRPVGEFQIRHHYHQKEIERCRGCLKEHGARHPRSFWQIKFDEQKAAGKQNLMTDD